MFKTKLTPSLSLQAAKMIHKNHGRKQLIKGKVILDAGIQRTSISKIIRKSLNVSAKAIEDVNSSMLRKFRDAIKIYQLCFTSSKKPIVTKTY